MTSDDFMDLLFEKRERINKMHQIIRKSERENFITKDQKEVLMRGYIILIYSMWESAYKDLGEYFINVLKEKEVKNLPQTLKNSILVFDIKKIRNKETITSRCIDKAQLDYENLKKGKVKDILTEKPHLKENFLEHTNNPTFKHIKKLFQIYNFGVSIGVKIEKEVTFIIGARNDIAHSGNVIKNCSDIISQEFIDYAKIDIDILEEISFSISVFYKSIIDEFKKRYA